MASRSRRPRACSSWPRAMCWSSGCPAEAAWGRRIAGMRSPSRAMWLTATFPWRRRGHAMARTAETSARRQRSKRQGPRGLMDPVSLELCWSRLIAIVDEAAAALVRTSFSTVVRECNDFAVVLLDENGYAVAQSSMSVPGFLGTAPLSLRAMLKAVPKDTLEAGDVLFTNDPWVGTGHLPDSTIAAPIFRDRRLIGFVVTVAHLSDVGGRQWSADANEMFEEGVRIPVIKFRRRGTVDATVLKILDANVRVPDQVFGDINAQMVAIDLVAVRLLELLAE